MSAAFTRMALLAKDAQNQHMAAKPRIAEKPCRWHRGANIPMRVIRKFARDVAERFQSDKFVLFGSYAYGKPHAVSDVDILVVMPCRNPLRQALQIELACGRPFPLDIIVRASTEMAWRLAEHEPFLTKIVSKGVGLHEKNRG